MVDDVDGLLEGARDERHHEREDPAADLPAAVREHHADLVSRAERGVLGDEARRLEGPGRVVLIALGDVAELPAAGEVDLMTAQGLEALALEKELALQLEAALAADKAEQAPLVEVRVRVALDHRDDAVKREVGRPRPEVVDDHVRGITGPPVKRVHQPPRVVEREDRDRALELPDREQGRRIDEGLALHRLAGGHLLEVVGEELIDAPGRHEGALGELAKVGVAARERAQIKNGLRSERRCAPSTQQVYRKGGNLHSDRLGKGF